MTGLVKTVKGEIRRYRFRGRGNPGTRGDGPRARDVRGEKP